MIPFGFCHCGCGHKTSLNKIGRGNGTKKDDPYKFIAGHHFFKKRVNLDNAAPFKIDGVYCRLIPLTSDQFAIVWESDYEWLTQWRWHAARAENGKYYAGRTHPDIAMHLEILGLRRGSELRGDHINGNTLDNRRSNLRAVTRAENAMNRALQKNNKTGCTGVTILRSGRYSSKIVAYNRIINLGTFSTFEEAKIARLEAEKEYHGEFSGRSSRPSFSISS